MEASVIHERATAFLGVLVRVYWCFVVKGREEGRSVNGISRALVMCNLYHKLFFIHLAIHINDIH